MSWREMKLDSEKTKPARFNEHVARMKVSPDTEVRKTWSDVSNLLNWLRQAGVKGLPRRLKDLEQWARKAVLPETDWNGSLLVLSDFYESRIDLSQDEVSGLLLKLLHETSPEGRPLPWNQTAKHGRRKTMREAAASREVAGNCTFSMI